MRFRGALGLTPDLNPGTTGVGIKCSTLLKSRSLSSVVRSQRYLCDADAGQVFGGGLLLLHGCMGGSVLSAVHGP